MVDRRLVIDRILGTFSGPRGSMAPKPGALLTLRDGHADYVAETVLE
jgi:hypothetical protein